MIDLKNNLLLLLKLNIILKQYWRLTIFLGLFHFIIISGEAEGINKPLIIALGDSLTAGYGVEESLSYPNRLQNRLNKEGFPHRVINAGVSGDTTAGGLRRINWVLKQQPDIVILALGANDALRGLPPSEIEKNLKSITKMCLAKGVKVLLAGMKAPPNYGQKYSKEFEEIYYRLAKVNNIPYVPFLLEGVAGIKGLNQPDGIHPTAEGYALVTELVWKVLLSMLE